MVKDVRTWKDPEVPQTAVQDEAGAPLDPTRPEEFHFSDRTGDGTAGGAGSSSESEGSQRAAAGTARRLEAIPEDEDPDGGLLTEALRALGKAPKRPAKRPSRRSSVEGSEAESRRGAERSKREGGAAGRKRASGRERSRSPSASSGESGSRGRRSSRHGAERRQRDSEKTDQGSPSPSASSPSSSGGTPAGRAGAGRDRNRKEVRRRRSRSLPSRSGSARPRGSGSRKIATYAKLQREFRRKPLNRWRYVEKQAALSGYSGSNAVELFVGECTQLGKAVSTAYLSAILARVGHEAANGRAELAAGLAAAALGFLDTLYGQGEMDLAWRTTLGEDPIVVSRSPSMAKSLPIPESGPEQAAQANAAFAHRMAFSRLIPAEVLEGTLEAGKQWKAWDKLARQS